ncbi:MAG: PrsW family glutamic-type intramembrane protease [Planctomycetaceae bacterium]|nr:PrsW family glutamic-type intramembrane protease [Planctomycetaceae bacterium]
MTSNDNLTTEVQWFLGNSESQKGPYSTEVVRKGILDGKLHARIKALRVGSDSWIPLNEIPDFAEVFASATATTVRWFLGNPGAMKGPYETKEVQRGITGGRISPLQQAVQEGSANWTLISEIPEFVDACINAPTKGWGDTGKKTAQKILEEFRQTDFKNEIIPLDANNYQTLVKDVMFWVVLILGVAPLIIASFQDITIQFLGMLFFFAMFWGGLLRGVVLKSNDKIPLPVAAFFFTGIIGMPLLLYVYSWHPEFYLTMPEHQNFILRFVGSILHTGIWEELCKILPVIAYLIWKRQDAQPLMVILIGVFSGLGFAAFENIAYGERSINLTILLGLEGVKQTGAEGLIAGIAQGTQAAMINVMLRSLSLVFAHALWTGIFAYYLTRAVQSGTRWYVLCFLGLAVPAVLHGTYNWFQSVQPAFAALIIAFSFVLFYGYLTKLRQGSQ